MGGFLLLCVWLVVAVVLSFRVAKSRARRRRRELYLRALDSHLRELGELRAAVNAAESRDLLFEDWEDELMKASRSLVLKLHDVARFILRYSALWSSDERVPVAVSEARAILLLYASQQGIQYYGLRKSLTREGINFDDPTHWTRPLLDVEE